MSHLRTEAYAGSRIAAFDISGTATTLAILYARIALGAAFLSAVASRFGLWQHEPAMKRFAGFLQRTAELNSFMPAATVPLLAWSATLLETALGIALIVSGLMTFSPRGRAEWIRWVAWGSAALLALFGTAMAIADGIKSPLDYSVFSASACALLLAVYPERRWRV
jgi:hypothetical protein